MSVFDKFKFHRQTEYSAKADYWPYTMPCPGKDVLGCSQHGRHGFDPLCSSCLSVACARGNISFSEYMRLCDELRELGMSR